MAAKKLAMNAEKPAVSINELATAAIFCLARGTLLPRFSVQ